jgi:hypothetical protein
VLLTDLNSLCLGHFRRSIPTRWPILGWGKAPGTMAASYSGVYVFGDSLVDAGNALQLAQTYDYFPFTSLPNGAPTSAKGYYKGRFTDGYTYADLISNKFIGVPTKPIFPFGYDDPYLGFSFGFFSDPSGNNLNFGYGGAQIR